MYKDDPLVEPPDNENTTIWRYMDFTKFVSLLDARSLFFSQAAHLSDRFEGSLSVPTARLIERSFRRSGVEDPDLRDFKRSAQRNFINSWHINPHESAAMWRLFVRSEEGTAIKTTFRRLTESFHATEYRVFIGKVRYIDFQADYIEFPAGRVNTVALNYHKRLSFEHERELRAVIQPSEVSKVDEAGGTGDDYNSQGSPQNGMYVQVDLDRLIDEIYVSPLSEKWFEDLVRSVISKYRLDKNTRMSDLTHDPIF